MSTMCCPGVQVEATAAHHGRLLVTAPGHTIQELTLRLVAAGVGVVGVRAARRLEDVFLGLVGPGQTPRDERMEPNHGAG